MTAPVAVIGGGLGVLAMTGHLTLLGFLARMGYQKVYTIGEFHDGPVLGAESRVVDGQVRLLAIADELI